MTETDNNNKDAQKSYDWKIVKWIFNFAIPYKWFLLLALVFMVATALFELAAPYITKIAVDRYISPPWRMATFESDKKSFEESLLQSHPHSLIQLPDSAYLINIADIDKRDRTELEKSGIVSNESYLVIDLEDFDANNKEEIKTILRNNPHVFDNSNGVYYAKFDSIKSLDPADARILRAYELISVTRLAGLLFLALLGSFISSTIFNYLLQYSGQKIMHRIRHDMFSHILSLPQKFFDKNPVGLLTTRVTNDVNSINEMYTSVIVQFIKDILVVVGVLAVMFYMNAALTLMILFLTVLIGIFGAIFRVKLRRAYRNVRRSIAKLNAFVQESVNGILSIKLYMREKQNFERFKVVSRENFDANMQQVFAFSTFRPIIEFISVFGIAMIVWYGGVRVLRLELTLGALLAYLAYIRMLFAPILELAERFNISQSAMAASENLYKLTLLDTERGHGASHPNTFSGNLEFKNVWFSYNDNDWVLKDVSFSVRPGQTVALVGLSGSGKTTIVNLILNLYGIQKGEILFDGVPVNQYDPEYIRSNISTVFQDTYLFGKHDERDGSEHIKSISENLMIKNNRQRDGDSYSSGEKQVFTIGSAFTKNAKFLILDEATSHVDAEIEQRVQELLKKTSDERSTLIIAHRLSNVKTADNIIVMHKGEIHETGTHDELLDKKGIYYNLYRLQREIHHYSAFAD